MCPLFYSSHSVLTCYSADSPHPSTPTVPHFGSNPRVAEDADVQNDTDPFETSIKLMDKVEKAPTTIASTAPLEPNLQRVQLRQSPSSTESMVGSSQMSADALSLDRFASHPEKPFTRDESLLFHLAPRQYTLSQKDSLKSNDGAPNGVFVLRSSPHIIEEDSSDDESGPEDQDDDSPKHSLPYDDSKIDQLVSAMSSLNLGDALAVARPVITPTRVRAHILPFVPARTPVSSPVAELGPVTVNPSTTQSAWPMEVDEDVLYSRVAINDASHPHWGIPEAALMDGVVFHPEANDTEMVDTFTTNRKHLQVAPPLSVFVDLVTAGAASTRGPIDVRFALCRPQPAFGTTWNPKSTPNQAQRSVPGAPSSTPQQPRVPQRAVFDFLCRSPKPVIFSGPGVPSPGFFNC